MPRDHADALIDHLLREELGGDRPRDLTARIMAMAQAHDRRRRTWWIGGSLATAAAIALAVTLFVFWPRSYPAPGASGDFVVDGGGTLERGARIQTNGATELKLGGYVEAEVEPHTRLALGGEKFKEKLLVEEGALNCNVEKKRGQFDVQVGTANVHVTGTTFTVKVTPTTRAGTSGRSMVVHVDEGSVVVEGVPERKAMTLAKGRGETFFIPDNLRKPPAVKPVPATKKTEPVRNATTRPAATRERSRESE